MLKLKLMMMRIRQKQLEREVKRLLHEEQKIEYRCTRAVVESDLLRTRIARIEQALGEATRRLVWKK